MLKNLNKTDFLDTEKQGMAAVLGIGRMEETPYSVSGTHSFFFNRHL